MFTPIKISIIISIIIVACLATFFLFYQYQINTPLNSNADVERIFIISKGESVNAISENLFEQKLIRSKPFFNFYILTRGFSSKIQAGSYSLSPNMSIKEIADKLVGGDTIKISLTVPEGYNLKEIENKLISNFQFLSLREISRRGIISNQIPNPNFQIAELKVKNFQGAYDFLRGVSETNNLEGFLFPDTYYFSLDATSESVVIAMLDNFDKKLTQDLRDEIKKQGESIYEVITMASIIEKEVRSDEDMEIVSGILWKRLKIGMPLQVDATISYLTGKKTTEVTAGDLDMDSPYNTYKNKGLPPGPISSPGLRAIKAAIFPRVSDNLYYLSAKDGRTIFSKTLEDHNIAKREYLK